MGGDTAGKIESRPTAAGQGQKRLDMPADNSPGVDAGPLQGQACATIGQGRRSLDEIYRSSPFSESETNRRLHAFLVLSLVRAGARTPSSSADVSIHS